MKILIYLLLIILVILIALIIVLMRAPKQVSGGAESEMEPSRLALDILSSMKPYLLDVNKPNYIIDHLRIYRKTSTISKRSVKDVPEKYTQLYHLIEDLIDAGIESVRDFWNKLDISYDKFLPKTKANLLNEAYLKPKANNISKLTNQLNSYLDDYNIKLNEDEANSVAKSLLMYNRLYKIRYSHLNDSTARLRKMIKNDPTSVLEYDMFSILMRLEPCTLNAEKYDAKRSLDDYKMRESLRRLKDLTTDQIYELSRRLRRGTLLDDLKAEEAKLERERLSRDRAILQDRVNVLRAEVESLKDVIRKKEEDAEEFIDITPITTEFAPAGVFDPADDPDYVVPAPVIGMKEDNNTPREDGDDAEIRPENHLSDLESSEPTDSDGFVDASTE